jgi:hypothetical protein
MPKHYRCPVCKTDKFFELTTKIYLQPACEKAGCFGRLEFIESTPGPVAPTPPPVLSRAEIERMTQSLFTQRDGTFCAYRLEEDRRRWKITFRGSTVSDPTGIYEFELDAGGSPAYELPSWQEHDSLTSGRFVRNSRGSIDFALPPGTLHENRGKSFGHGSGLTKPIRIQIGAQDPNNEHSGSGLIHIMFSHQKTNITGVEQLLSSILAESKIGAIYRSKTEEYGFFRYFFLNRAREPYRLVTEMHEGYFRLITVFKPEGGRGYNQFMNNPGRYVRIYSWDRDVY